MRTPSILAPQDVLSVPLAHDLEKSPIDTRCNLVFKIRNWTLVFSDQTENGIESLWRLGNTLNTPKQIS